MNLNFRKHLPEYRNRINTVTSQPLIKLIFYSTITINILGLFFIAVIFSQLPQQIPLYYSRPWGEDQITSPIYLFILPLGSLAFHYISLLLIVTQTYRYRVYSQLLIIFSLLVTILSSFTIYNIIRLVL